MDKLVDFISLEIADPKHVDVCLVMRVDDCVTRGNANVLECSECKSKVWADNNTSAILKLGKARLICNECFIEKKG